MNEQLPPLSSPQPIVPLAVPGFGDAVTVLPVGITRPAPIVVAVIGIGDTPEDQCAVWRELVGQRAFVFCPRGQPNMVRPEPEAPDAQQPGRAEPGESQESDESAEERGQGEGEPATRRSEAPLPSEAPKQVGWYQPDLATLEREISSGLGALRARWGEYVADQEVLYAGFSRGAFLGAQFVAKHPERFKRAVLVEGGHSPWTESQASAFARGGGKRVLFACGQQSCVDDAKTASAALNRENVETLLVFGEGEGHGYKKQVKEELRRSIDWVTEGDALWRQLLAGTPAGNRPASK